MKKILGLDLGTNSIGWAVFLTQIGFLTRSCYYFSRRGNGGTEVFSLLRERLGKKLE